MSSAVQAQAMLNKARPGRSRILLRALVACALFILSSLLLSACGSGGILSSGSWQASGLQNQQLRVLEVNEKDLRTLYTGNAQGHVFVSTDAGQNWIEQSAGLPLPNPIHALSFDSAGQKIYAASAKGLFTKTWNATQWTAVRAAGLPARSFTALAFEPGASTVAYTGTAGQGVYMSKDGTSPWNLIDKGLPQRVTVNDLSYDPVQHQLWAATSAGAYRFEKSRASWQSFNAGLPTAITVNTVVPASTIGGASGMLYMGTNHGFFMSQDAGTHWTATKESLPGTNIRRILLDFRSTNTSSLYVATDAGAFHSGDNGQSWLAVASNLPKGTPVYALAIGADNYAQLYAVGAGVYQFPGTGAGIDPTRILPFLLVAAFFFLLYRLSQRGRKTRRDLLKPERIQETPASKPPASSA
jgi:ligand-binding sensor domain-containing protein